MKKMLADAQNNRGITPTKWTPPGPHLNIKTVFPTYDDSRVKDKTAARPSNL